ncbi:MAG: RraA family protein [Alphaproteobacteria bacterium]|nr:RraA family protein [Alphaproteobacteria bacterium]
MFTLNPLPPQLDRKLLDKLVRAEPATIGHFRNWGFMDPAIRAMIPNVRIAGPAVTVRAPGIDGTIVGYALGQVRPGDVLVIDRCGDHRHAAFGGLVAYACKTAKLAGVIIDGVATDIGEVRQYNVPLWCRGLSAVTTKRIGLGGEFCVPVTCGGANVNPGDVIIADECGVVVLDPKDAEAAAERAIGMQDAEIKSRARLDAGEKLPDISGATKMLQEALAKQNQK